MIGPRRRTLDAQEWLQNQSCDILIAFNDGQNSFLESNAVYVFTGFRPIGESAAVITREGELFLFVTPVWDLERAKRLAVADHVVATSDLGAALVGFLDDGRISGIGVACISLAKQRRALAAKVTERLQSGPLDAGSLASQLARIRTQQERESMRCAVAIAERGYERLKASARAGMREFELAADIYCFMKELGAEDNFLLMSASQHNLAVRAAGRRVLEAGDVILAEITPCVNGQFVQICRTVRLGRPSVLLQEKFALLQLALERGLAAATPGAKVSDATQAMNDCFRAAGYADYCRPPYMRVRGHGLGITSDRPGDLHNANDTVFEEGMAFVMHPNQYLPETGYLMCGETVTISHNGAVSLSERDATLDWIDV